MENAGRGAADAIQDFLGGSVRGKRIAVVAGVGNNGGDGVVAARHLAGMGHAIYVILAGLPDRITTPEAAANWSALERCPYSIRLSTIHDSADVQKLPIIGDDEIIVDALLGSGIKGTVRQPIAACINYINDLKEKLGVPVVSVDVPSGMNMDDGSTANIFIRASHTITFHLPKVGFTNKESITGNVHLESIGIPPEAGWLVGKGDVKSLFKHHRGAESIKGMNGKVVVIGGSKQYSGAPILAALAALRCGVDLVHLYAPESVAAAAKAMSPDLIVTSLPGETITSVSEESIKTRIEWADAVLIGPGAGRNEDTLESIKNICKIASRAGKRVIIDADGLHAIAGHIDEINTPNTLLTPHAGELAILSNVNPSKIKNIEQKVEFVQNLVKRTYITCIVKGHHDIIASKQDIKINTTGTPAMTVGGTGDVLAGIATGLSALFSRSKASMFKIATAAAHVNGLLGEHAEKAQGGPFITASMLLDRVGHVLSSFR